MRGAGGWRARPWRRGDDQQRHRRHSSMSFVRLALRQQLLSPACTTRPLYSFRALLPSHTARSHSYSSARWPRVLVLGLVPLVHVHVHADSSQETSPSAASESLSQLDRPDIPPPDDEPSPRSTVTRSLERWIIEPLATLRRFIHLFVLFFPVIVTSPVLLLESLISPTKGEEELALTRCWYRLLVAQMERAGPTFIKVTP
jgi:aarF domain-containing kinase